MCHVALATRLRADRVVDDHGMAVDLERARRERERLDTFEVRQPVRVDQISCRDHANSTRLGRPVERKGIGGLEPQIVPKGGRDPFRLGAKSAGKGHGGAFCSSASFMSLRRDARRSGTPGRITDAARRCSARGATGGDGACCASAW